MIKIILLLICIFVMSVEDIRMQSIPVWQIILTLCIFCSYLWITHDFEWGNLMAAAVIGELLTVLSFITGWIGTGDAALIAIITIFMGITFTGTIIFVAVLLLSFTSIGLLIAQKGRGRYEVPFIPYLFASVLGVVLCG